MPSHAESNDLFDTADGRISRADSALRLRRTERESRLTFKGPARFDRGIKTREERETTVGNPVETEAILRRIGLERRFRYEKRREEWTFADCAIALDETPIGAFVEIEGAPTAIRRGRREPRARLRLRDAVCLPAALRAEAQGRSPSAGGHGLRRRRRSLGWPRVAAPRRIPSPRAPGRGALESLRPGRRARRAVSPRDGLDSQGATSLPQRPARGGSSRAPAARGRGAKRASISIIWATRSSAASASIRARFRSSSFFWETRILGTAGALRNAASFLAGDDFLLVNADAAIAFDPGDLLARHREAQSARDAARRRESGVPTAIRRCSPKGSTIARFGGEGPSPLLYTGVCVALAGRARPHSSRRGFARDRPLGAAPRRRPPHRLGEARRAPLPTSAVRAIS